MPAELKGVRMLVCKKCRKPGKDFVGIAYDCRTDLNKFMKGETYEQTATD